MKVRVLGNRKVMCRNPWGKTELGKRKAYLRGNPWPWDGKEASAELGRMTQADLQLLEEGLDETE